jgi:2-polyprenyl-3-methyl-5-hydroxy-6-metoxy-1,4-benzoquinol methylase
MNTENFYTNLDAIYADPDSLMSRKIRLVERSLVPADSLLDLGCGTGAFIQQVKEKFKQITGTDADVRSVSRCSERFKGEAKISLRQMTAETIETLHTTFDAVTCLDVLEHLDDPELALAKIHALLKPNGQLIVTMPNWYNRIIAYLVNDKLHKQFHSSLGWGAMLQRHGFRVVTIRTVAFPVINSDFLSRNLHLLGMCVLISAVKE